MPPETISSDQRRLLDDICPLHQTPMVRTANHVGDGQVSYDDPKCPLCEDLKERGKYDEAKAAIEGAAKKKELPQPSGVKPAGDAPAAKP